ncbi:MAG TPA: CbiX/SirB N-terminal domain-containing protein [Terriglobia bacterium]|nr:CbiX/SirB N-terminal domain-containing protein [Terriglobia bacterium]
MNEDEKSLGVILFAHGSAVEEANQSVHNLARGIQEEGPYGYVRGAFLDVAQPNLDAAIAQAVEAGVRRVIVIPYFLTEGIHLQRDLPNLIVQLKERYADLEIEVGRSLDDHPQMASIILGRVREVIGETKAAR